MLFELKVGSDVPSDLYYKPSFYQHIDKEAAK